MPRRVDHEQRRWDIIEATLTVLAESGTRGLSFRAVATKLGGSTTLITHYFPTQQALLDAATIAVLDRWKEENQGIDARSDDPRQRLRNLLIWLVPTTDAGLRDERARINLLSGRLLGDSNRTMFETWDRVIREFLRSQLEGLVPAESLDARVELLRIAANGVVLAVVERPDAWPPERQLAMIDNLLSLLELMPAQSD